MKNRFGFLLFPGLEELDLVGPWEMITVWGKEYGGPAEVFTVSETGGLITCSKKLQIASTYSFQSCPKLDYLLIPGGIGTRTEIYNKALITFIQSQAQSCDKILSVCTGALLLQAAGLLKGRKATTYWQILESFKKDLNIEVVEKRYVKDGNIWTSAGISAGIDMALAFIADRAGKAIAGKVQLHSEYFPEGKNYLTADDVKGFTLPDYLAL